MKGRSLHSSYKETYLFVALLQHNWVKSFMKLHSNSDTDTPVISRFLVKHLYVTKLFNEIRRGRSSGLNPASAKIRYLLLFRESQLKYYSPTIADGKNFHPYSLLLLVDRLYTVIHKTQKPRTKVLPFATVGE